MKTELLVCPTPERLNREFSFNAETGIVTRKTAAANQLVGKTVGSSNSHGYLYAQIDYCKFRLHRAIWAMVHGSWPTEEIDHINGNRKDNRLANLRHVSRQQNATNLGIRSNNKSGHKGVSWNKCRKKWMASISIAGKSKNLGGYKHLVDAVAAYKHASQILHGEFARIDPS
jgi:hypothetical protein